MMTMESVRNFVAGIMGGVVVWCLFGVYSYSVSERIVRNEEKP
jgi:hypothetical protein